MGVYAILQSWPIWHFLKKWIEIFFTDMIFVVFEQKTCSGLWLHEIWELFFEWLWNNFKYFKFRLNCKYYGLEYYSTWDCILITCWGWRQIHFSNRSESWSMFLFDQRSISYRANSPVRKPCWISINDVQPNPSSIQWTRCSKLQIGSYHTNRQELKLRAHDNWLLLGHIWAFSHCKRASTVSQAAGIAHLVGIKNERIRQWHRNALSASLSVPTLLVQCKFM